MRFEEFLQFSMGNVPGALLPWVQEWVLARRRKAKPSGSPHHIAELDITIDTPLPFSIKQLWLDLFSYQCANHYVSENQNQDETTRAYVTDGDPKVEVRGDADALVRPRFRPVDQSAAAKTKVYKGQLAGHPRTHLDTLESRLRDPRMRFLFHPGKWSVATDGTTESDLGSLLKTWVGADAPISVFDLSGIPPAIVDDMVGTMLHILYDAMFWGRLKPEGGRRRPLLLVLEEAHLYLQSKGRAAEATRRIAREGRKYGVGLMLISQRPSEIDPSILSQCGTIVAMRLTNEMDQGQISRCAADTLKGLFSILPILRTGEALIVGEAVNIPVRALIHRPPEGRRPDSEDPLVVVSKDENGKRKKQGGWTEDVKSEDYKPLVEAWRSLNPSAEETAVKEPSETKRKE